MQGQKIEKKKILRIDFEVESYSYSKSEERNLMKRIKMQSGDCVMILDSVDILEEDLCRFRTIFVLTGDEWDFKKSLEYEIKTYFYILTGIDIKKIRSFDVQEKDLCNLAERLFSGGTMPGDTFYENVLGFKDLMRYYNITCNVEDDSINRFTGMEMIYKASAYNGSPNKSTKAEICRIRREDDSKKERCPIVYYGSAGDKIDGFLEFLSLITDTQYKWRDAIDTFCILYCRPHADWDKKKALDDIRFKLGTIAPMISDGLMTVAIPVNPGEWKEFYMDVIHEVNKVANDCPQMRLYIGFYTLKKEEDCYSEEILDIHELLENEINRTPLCLGW